MNKPAALALYDQNAIRAFDAELVGRPGNSALALMVRAGTEAYEALMLRWPKTRYLTVVCGAGNNAGDGYALARCAKADGLTVRVIDVGEKRGLSADAQTCYDAMVAAGVSIGSDFHAIEDADVVVDAIFGIGLSRDVDGDLALVIDQINDGKAPVMSIDIPSGIHATTGARLGVAVQADFTVTFIALKQGLYTGQGPACAGDIVLLGLDVGAGELPLSVDKTASLLQAPYVASARVPRSRTAHKGHHGHALLIGGAPGYVGAIRLAGEATARVGSGLVSVAAHPDVANYVNISRPELMVHSVADPQRLGKLLKQVNCIAIGPGLGQQAWGASLFGTVLATRLPLVIDADALNLLAADPTRRNNWVLTPHPGEAARLLNSTTAEINADRFAAVTELQKTYGGCVVLKGAGSLVFDGRTMAVVGAGNPGMASGGMGDVLTGVIVGLIAQGVEFGEAARIGTCLHAVAGDLAARAGERGLLASDLFEHIRTLVN